MGHKILVNLSDSQYEVLKDKRKVKGSSMSELIRQAVDKEYLAQTRLSERLKGLEAGAGIWKDRKDIGDSVAYVKKLRTPLGPRPKR